LIAFERADGRLIGFVEETLELGEEIAIPASALAQAWRGGSRAARLVRLMTGSDIDPLDEVRARQVGERLGVRGRTDVVDAHVVCCAIERNAALVTSDPDDLEALADPSENLVLVSV